MGGLAFVFAGVIASGLFTQGYDKTFLIAIVVSLAYMSVGFLDDLLKCKHRQNLGLKAWQKFAFQSGIAIFVAIYCYRAGVQFLNIPFLNTTLFQYAAGKVMSLMNLRFNRCSGISIQGN